MSYSTCLICEKMVGGYQKYCERCLKKHKLRQGDWRNFRLKTAYGTPERKQEVLDEMEKDKLGG